ncbi:Panacea domain-containing protein [Corynebacterium sp. CCUG 51687]|uniref:Panacea domain-containing protein n=1 Tax=Corynebacterium sp. CCUG 51687 TaxID=2823897 RepID=UPI00210E1639|nr:Panacea domain-containing protein [Corynebacterium sp. CCUG 51687]MCQ4611800.1 DUF4065 domain-containing protein [Corynebacterium sp. CCUG 51687]
MATSIDVAQYIYNKMGWMDAWKLAKLTYYVQAWSLGWFGKPLFAEEFQAWADGPVEPKLHTENRYCRRGITDTQLPSSDVSRLTAQDIETIDAVLDFYGGFTKEELINRTHSEMPWLKARAGLAAGERSRNPVSQSSMRRFYADQELKKVDGPCRPRMLVHGNHDQTRAQFRGAVERWETALTILATR